MRRWITGFLQFDLVIAMLFLGVYGLRGRTVAADSGLVQIMGEEAVSEEVKKIAITFDGDVIIGLSQGIC